MISAPPVVLTFAIDFHAPFRVGAAYPKDGLDLTPDLDDPLPADHLKGLMRAEAASLCQLLTLSPELVAETFGTSAAPSAWHWSSVVSGHDWTRPQVRHRVARNRETQTALRDHLVAASAMYEKSAWFSVSCDEGLTTKMQQRQAALLRLSARSVHHLGGWRRRGYGWCGIRVRDDSSLGSASQVTEKQVIQGEIDLLRRVA